MANLIVYYSRKGQNYWNGSIVDLAKGNTERVAEFVRKAVGGDLFEIETVREYSKDYMTCTEEAKAELREGARPELKKYLDSLRYDLCGLSQLVGHHAHVRLYLPGALRPDRQEDRSLLHQRRQRHGRQRTGTEEDLQGRDGGFRPQHPWCGSGAERGQGRCLGEEKCLIRNCADKLTGKCTGR